MKILVVDDEEAVRKLVCRILRDHSFDPIECESGLAALAAMVADKPDLILLDLDMPQVGGIALARELKKHAATREIPIIILTAHPRSDYVKDAAQIGASDFLVKTNLTPENLVGRIKHALARIARPPLSAPPPVVERPPPPPPPETPPPAEPPPPPGPPSPLTREKIVAQLDHIIDLKALPFIVAEVIQVASDSNADAKLLAQTVARDPVVTGRVLQFANSAFIRMHGRTQNLNHAVTQIGFHRIRDITIAIKLVEEYGGSAKTPAPIDRVEFWKHSLCVAVLARDLLAATNAKTDDIELAFLMGLLHDVGQTFLLDHFPEDYIQAMKLVRAEGLSYSEAEERIFGIRHGEISRRVLARWKLFEGMIEPIVFHHFSPADIAQRTGAQAKLSVVIWLANALSKTLRIGTDGDDLLEETPDSIAELLSLKAAKLESMLGTVSGEVEQLSQILLMHGGAAGTAPPKPEPLPRDIRVALVRQGRSEIDLVELLLKGLGWTVRTVGTLGAAFDDASTQLVIVQLKAEAWLLDQMGQNTRASLRPIPILLLSPEPLTDQASVLLVPARPRRMAGRIAVGPFLEMLRSLMPSAN